MCVPTFDDVVEYARGRNGNVDPREFYDYYETNGWKQKNGNAVKNWQAAFRTWEQRAKPQKKKTVVSQTPDSAWKEVHGVMHRWNPTVGPRELSILSETVPPLAMTIASKMGWNRLYEGDEAATVKREFVDEYERLSALEAK